MKARWALHAAQNGRPLAYPVMLTFGSEDPGDPMRGSPALVSVPGRIKIVASRAMTRETKTGLSKSLFYSAIVVHFF
jgi:hypothetical protein